MQIHINTAHRKKANVKHKEQLTHVTISQLKRIKHLRTSTRLHVFDMQPGSLMTPMSGGASPSQAGGSSPSVLDSSAGMSPSQQSVPLGCPNSVLRVVIENMIYPITLDVLNQVRTCTHMHIHVHMHALYMENLICI